MVRLLITLVIAIGILLTVAILSTRGKITIAKQSCSYYSDYALQDVPARCLKYFQK